MPSAAKRGTSSGASSWACSMRCRRPSAPSGSRVALERVEGVAVRGVADRVHRDGQPRLDAGEDDRLELLAARDRTPEPSSISAVCEPSVPSMNAFR